MFIFVLPNYGVVFEAYGMPNIILVIPALKNYVSL